MNFTDGCARNRVFSPRSALRYTLEALVPYTDANSKLAKPHLFFNELEKIDAERHYSRATLKRAYYEAKRKGYIISDDGQPRLSSMAQQKLRPFQPAKRTDSYLMVVFDIPENERWKRRWFRLLLVEMKFEQIQKSVWVSKYESPKFCRPVYSLISLKTTYECLKRELSTNFMILSAGYHGFMTGGDTGSSLIVDKLYHKTVYFL